MRHRIANDRVPVIARSGRWMGIGLFFIVLFTERPTGLTPEGHRLLAVTLLMATWWLTSAIPIYVTSLLPLALFPILGILTAKTVSAAYISHTVFLYFGGFVIALGMERWMLHRRIALKILAAVGGSPRGVVLGFMLATAFLSMWISNTATTLLMLPIALSLLSSMEDLSPESVEKGSATERPLEIALLLGIAYSASIGGMITLVGTPTNVAFAEIFRRNFPDAPELSMGAWIVAFLPLGVAYLGLTWWLLCRKVDRKSNLDKNFFKDRLRGLGAMTSGERKMLVIFLVTASLWMFRNDLDFGIGPIIPGWGGFVESWMIGSLGVDPDFAHGAINDSTVAMVMCILLFLIPAKKPDSEEQIPLMDWETLNRLPWGILLLFGGGFALADAFTSTGLSDWIGGGAGELLSSQPSWVIVAGLCFTLTFLTEFTTNVATVSALMPVLASLSINLGMDPRLVMIPTTLATSCAFMLPIATPPNAIIFGSGRIRIGTMARKGVILNLAGVVLITATTFYWAMPRLGIVPNQTPDWVNSTETNAESE